MWIHDGRWGEGKGGGGGLEERELNFTPLVLASCIVIMYLFHFRDFFSQNGYECSVEFSKESDNDMLYIALKFDSRSVAKEVLNK